MGREGLDQDEGGGTRQVFGYFQAERQIEPTAEIERRGEVGGTEAVVWDLERLAADPSAVHALNVCHAESRRRSEPAARAAAEIDDACRRDEVEHPRQYPVGRGAYTRLECRVVRRVVFAAL